MYSMKCDSCISEFRKASKIIREFRQNATHIINLSCHAVKYQNPTLEAINNKRQKRFASLTMDTSLIFEKIVATILVFLRISHNNKNPIEKLINFVDRLIYGRANFSRFLPEKCQTRIKYTTWGLNSRFMRLLLFDFARREVYWDRRQMSDRKKNLSWKVKSHRRISIRVHHEIYDVWINLNIRILCVLNFVLIIKMKTCIIKL